MSAADGDQVRIARAQDFLPLRSGKDTAYADYGEMGMPLYQGSGVDLTVKTKIGRGDGIRFHTGGHIQKVGSGLLDCKGCIHKLRIVGIAKTDSHNKACAAGCFDRLNQLHEKADPVFKTAPVPIVPRTGLNHFVQIHSVGGVELDAVESRLPAADGRRDKRLPAAQKFCGRDIRYAGPAHCGQTGQHDLHEGGGAMGVDRLGQAREPFDTDVLFQAERVPLFPHPQDGTGLQNDQARASFRKSGIPPEMPAGYQPIRRDYPKIRDRRYDNPIFEYRSADGQRPA